jgi:purine-binding chemotaxis protein CheW
MKIMEPKAENKREEIQVLTFTVNSVTYGVNIHQVREVKNFEGITPVPYTAAYVKGVTNLRGEVIPVIDLRERLCITGNKGDKDAENTGILVVAQDKKPLGFIVDSVMDVLTIFKKDIESNLNDLSADGSKAIVGLAKHDKDLLILLDLMQVISNVQ